MNKRKAIIITGASGFIGSKLTDIFIKNSYIVYAYDLVNNLNKNTNIIFTKYNINEQIEEAPFKEVDTIIHCAYIKDKDDKNSYKKNINGSKQLIEITRKHNVNFVFLTSMSAHDKAESQYGKSKYIIEKHLDETKDLIIRPGLVIGSGGGLFNSMQDIINKTKIIPLISNKKNIIQYIDINELVKFIYYATEHKLKGKYTIASQKGISMKELYKAIAQKENKKIFFMPINYSIVNALMYISELFHIKLGIDRENLKGLKKMRYYKTDKIEGFEEFSEIKTILDKQ